MKISIVTISFNQKDFIERAIRSVHRQRRNTAHTIEYIVVDAGSTDGSIDLIKKHADKVNVFICEKDRGPADGLNKGFAIASGEIFGYINADDAFLPGAIEEAASLFEASIGTDIIYGSGWIVDGAGKVLRHVFSDSFSVRGALAGAVTILQQATFFRRGVFLKAGGFNVMNRTCWDGELVLRMIGCGARATRVIRPWAIFAIYDSSITGSGRFNDTYAKDHSRIMNDLAEAFALPLRTHSLQTARMIRLIRSPVTTMWSFVEAVLRRPIWISDDQRRALDETLKGLDE